MRSSSLLLLAATLMPLARPANSLRVASFNVWRSGSSVHDGLNKIVRHIQWMNADIVALQEIMSSSDLLHITESLGPPWQSVGRIDPDYIDSAIISRFPIDYLSAMQTPYAVGATIQIDRGLNITFYSVHLTWHYYGPYLACDPNARASQAELNEAEMGDLSVRDPTRRYQNLLEIVGTEHFRTAFRMAENQPIIFAGDFNAPSHLDWTFEMSGANCGWTHNWPVSEFMDKSLGFIDSFRHVYPQPSSYWGVTWSPVIAENKELGFEPQDRIDYILYKSSKLEAVQAFVYSGYEYITKMPNHYNNDWPSDHSAVVTHFNIRQFPGSPYRS
uniref:Endonuclease/exonuclease/phosphatase domain-containing protein n=1 Tax=Plectus sambesii TaxID=2011161 RepID=A0A914W4Q6_9BILA